MLNRMSHLIEQLNIYRSAYYNENESIVSDKEYDDLFDELSRLEEETGVIMSCSPTNSVGYEVKSELKKVTHSHPMLSLNKTKDVNELIKFSMEKDFVLSCKMDGLTCLLTYDNGELIRAETRGNGSIGEDITHNAKVFENIPLTIPNKNLIEIEGEAIITYNDFNTINDKITGSDRYKNPRNLASGSVRQLDSSIAKERHIKFIAWKLPKSLGYVINDFDFMSGLGFDIVPYVMTNDTEHMQFLIHNLRSIAKEKSYPIDGLVMTYNNVEYGKSLGMTGHHPKHSLAFKFYDEEVESELKYVEYSMNKTGSLTPVAVFNTIEIDGTEVERASLSNLSVMEETLGLYPYRNQKVYVTKRNMIIPKIEYSDIKDEITEDTLYIPFICPYCGSDTKVTLTNNTKTLYCTNDGCSGKMLGKFCHFSSRKALDINGLSEATLEYLIRKGWIKEFKDLFHLYQYSDKWYKVPGFGKKSVDKIIKNIENSKNNELYRFLCGLSIPLIGSTASKDIAKYCDDSFEKFVNVMDCDPNKLLNIDGFGNEMMKSLNDYWGNNRNNIVELACYFTFKKDNGIKEIRNILDGKIFVITGSLNIYENRDELKDKIESLGGKVSTSITGKTDYLINNDYESLSSKNKKAKILNIPIISEDDFVKIING